MKKETIKKGRYVYHLEDAEFNCRRAAVSAKLTAYIVAINIYMYTKIEIAQSQYFLAIHPCPPIRLSRSLARA